MKSNLTIVTALFDIGRGEMGTSFSRSFEHYKECFSRLLKLQHLSMVIFCEKSLEDFIWQFRSKENTRLIFKSLDDLRNFPFYNEIQNIRKQSKWITQSSWIQDSTQARLELYNPLVMSKQFFLNDASLHNFFDSNYFLWIDAGISNTVNIEQYLNEDFENKITHKLKKMLYVCFPYDGKVEVHGFEKPELDNLAGKSTEWVARGGIFGGPKHLINEINDIYYNLLHSTLRSNYMGTEESLFTIITYRHKDKCNLEFIESNGLVYKFFENLKNIKVRNNSIERLAIYSLTYNAPKQWEMWVNNFKKAFPKEFNTIKKYVINNTDDITFKDEYDKLFADNNFEVIHENQNVGINSGRHICATHFNNSDHEFYIFAEDDMHFCDNSYKDKTCKNGFVRWVPNLFDKIIQIFEKEELSALKLSFSEFYGDSHINWAWYNVPANDKAILFPERLDNVDKKKTKIDYTGSHDQLAYAIGEYHYCNWMILFDKIGNRKLFIDVNFEHKYEQTWMSYFFRDLIRKNEVKMGVLLASPIEHDRKYHYKVRKENEHYK